MLLITAANKPRRTSTRRGTGEMGQWARLQRREVRALPEIMRLTKDELSGRIVGKQTRPQANQRRRRRRSALWRGALEFLKPSSSWVEQHHVVIQQQGDRRAGPFLSVAIHEKNIAAANGRGCCRSLPSAENNGSPATSVASAPNRSERRNAAARTTAGRSVRVRCNRNN